MSSQSHLGTKYDTVFFDDLSDGSFESAKIVLPLVRDLVNPTTILDVGCGVGAWLAGWVSLGITDVIGLDGHYVDKSQLRIAQDRFIPTDLQRPFSLDRKFDLVQCLEVAEHLEAVHADKLIESLTRHGGVILFSAAIPGQGGTHHVNEQWPSYWIRKFAQFGFKPYDVIRPQIWNDRRVDRWYKQNMLIFSRERTFTTPAVNLTESSFNVVHPEMWDYANSYELHPREVVLNLPRALSVLFECRVAELRKKLGLPIGPNPYRRAIEAARREERDY